MNNEENQNPRTPERSVSEAAVQNNGFETPPPVSQNFSSPPSIIRGENTEERININRVLFAVFALNSPTSVADIDTFSRAASLDIRRAFENPDRESSTLRPRRATDNRGFVTNLNNLNARD